MKKTSKITYFIYIWILLLLISVFSFVLYQNIQNSHNTSYHYVMNTLDTNASQNELYVDWQKSYSWEHDGFGMQKNQYDITIYNHLDTSIYDWTIEVIVPTATRFDSGWNGSFSLKENVLTITPVEYNRIIGPNTSIPLGLIITAPENFQVKNFSFTIYKEYRLTDSIYFWLVLFLIIGLVIVVILSIIMYVRFHNLKSKQKISLQITEQALDTFAYILDAKDEYTNGHSKRVAIYSHELARRMGFPTEEQERIRRIAMLHDIGKVNIPDRIIHKDSSLSQEEWAIIRTHPTIGATILQDFTSIPDISVGAKYHHERYDGNGYPEGLKGEDIPLVARIISVADTYDAMASTRTYRQGVSNQEILEELAASSGTQLDPFIVPYMIDMIHDGFAPITDLPDTK